MRRAALCAAALLAPRLCAGTCPPPFVEQKAHYIASEETHSIPDPHFFNKPGIYGTKDPESPKGADFHGAQELCLGSAICKAFTFKPGKNDQDISSGVFFYGNTNTYSDPNTGKQFTAYTLNDAFINNRACYTPGRGPVPDPGNSTGGNGGDGGCQGGCYFLIAFFCGGFVYFAAGFAYKYKRQDLRGVEAVPNADFWRDLPYMVKDGVVFSFQRIRSAVTKDEYTTV